MMKFKILLREKVLLGSVLIGIILSLSGGIAFFEFGRMSNYISSLINNNLRSVSAINSLTDLSEQYNNKLFIGIGNDIDAVMPDMTPQKEIMDDLETMEKYLDIDEKQYLDSLRYAYTAYIHVVSEVDEVWLGSFQERRSWYINKVQVVFNKFKNYLAILSSESQKSLANNYDYLEDSYYRSIMPVVVAVCAGLLLIILFNYYLNIYILNPIVKMEKNLKLYKDFNKSYLASFDYGEDELQSMNQMVTEIVEENKILKSK